MSTTTKIEKEIKHDLAAMETAINSLTYAQLSDLLKEKKEKEIEAVSHKLEEAKGIVESLEAQLVNLGVTPAASATAPAKRGRKKGSKNVKAKAAKAKPAKKRKGKRGAVGASILAFLETKGAAGAKVADIAAATGNKPANVTAFFYAGAGKKSCKRVAPATFALKK